MKILFFFTALISLFVLSASPAQAVYGPLSVANNRVGIHIFSEKDLKDASALVNSGGGDWGYVTVVITQSERDHNRWQNAFDQMRRLHLIPIVRIATKAQGDTWVKPDPQEIDKWVSFLNSLNWVIRNRYVVIGNEPNLKNEWGGEVNPGEYAEYLKNFSSRLKSASPDFFVLPAGLNANERESSFISGMLKYDPKIFEYIDGWTSHAYPKPSLAIYNEELKMIGRNLPVFITETGWSNKNNSQEEIGRKLSDAFLNVWNDSRVVAITPFILDYESPPYDEYSWKSPNGGFYSFYQTVQNLSKAKGQPVQIEKGNILAAFSQPLMPLGGDFFGAILVKNTGQSIWTFNDIAVSSVNNQPIIKSYSFNDLEPFNVGLIIFKAQSPDNVGIYTSSIFLTGKKGQQITNSFPIEAAVLNLESLKIGPFFGNLLKLLKVS